MKMSQAILLIAMVMLMASVVPVCADDDEGTEASDNAASGENDDEKEQNMPGFEAAFALTSILVAARFFKRFMH
jgi:hypothetical protein